MSQTSVKVCLSISLIIFLLGLFLVRYGMLKFTYHVAEKSQTSNPFIKYDNDYSEQKQWNSNLYKKVVFFLLENYSYEWLSNHPKAQMFAHTNNVQYNYQWTLFDKLVKNDPKKAIFRKVEINSPQSALAKIATYMVGTNTAQFEVGIQSSNSFKQQEDSIFYQLSQNSFTTIGFLNNIWYSSFPNLLKENNNLHQEEKQAEEETDQNLLDYLKIQEIIKEGTFDFLFIHDSVQVTDIAGDQKSSSDFQKIQRIEEQMEQIINSISDDTLFIAISDRASNNFGGVNENVNTCFSDKPCSPFFFSYTKRGFIDQQEILQQIYLNVNKKEPTVHESQIACTLANLMGLPIPYSSSGRPLLDLYPSQLSETNYLKRVLRDSYTTFRQQLQFITTLQKKYSIFEPLKMRYFAQKAQDIELTLPKTSFDKEKIIQLIRNVVTIQEELKEHIYSNLIPYSMTWIYIGYFILFVSILFTICLIVSSRKEDSNNLNQSRMQVNSQQSEVTDRSSEDYDSQTAVTKKEKSVDLESQGLVAEQKTESSSSSTIDIFLNVTIMGQNFLYFHNSWNYLLVRQNYTSNQATCIIIISAELFLYFIYRFFNKPSVKSLWMPIVAGLVIALIKFLFVNRYVFQSSLPIIPFSEIAYPIIFCTIICIANAFAKVQYSTKKYANLLVWINVLSIVAILIQDTKFFLFDPTYKRVFFFGVGFTNLIICYLIKQKNNQTNLFILINQQLALVQFYVAIFNSSEKTEYLGLVDYLITSIISIVIFGLQQMLSRFSVQIYLVFLNTIYAFSSGIMKDSTQDSFNIFKNIYFTLFGIYLLNVQLLLNKEKTPIDTLSSYLTKINNSGNYKHESHKYVQVFGYFSIAVMIQIVFFFTSFLFIAQKFYFNLHFQTHSVFCDELLASFASHAIVMIYFILTYKSLLTDKKSKSQKHENKYEMVQQSPYNNLSTTA
ncbi:transmembrane protein, putative (macronuclear) [Tetrahymena thermophila SB210]|uniref:Transmembrane protein, putative n=1 Tax=Tetrahymena thermophila (strain SB210) TaxID=312017 RepID=W7XE75_TETTS|nr:transmembrane protein, putative [Tetrahymena thermophila SB210]EWS74853.1 transmembrane protein, putative [Tetrahymena thermophila SB210]|eukprot:XP_012652566.1 transmembrane protein, putative [Tetrahymena thermophila SB210]